MTLAAMRPAQHQCPVQAMAYDDRGATCTQCGLYWPFMSVWNREGRLVKVGYLTPPYKPAERATANPYRGFFE